MQAEDERRLSANLDAQIEAGDHDRWLSSRFVTDEKARADLMALYAFEAELEAIPNRVTQPLLAEMRLVWWAEQMDGVFEGTPRKGHPVLEALADVAARRGLERASVQAVIEARIQAAHGEAEDVEALYVGPMRLAARVLTGADQPEVDGAARVWAAAKAGRIDEAGALKAGANAELRRLPAAAFPAVAHAALVKRDEPEVMKRLRLVWAVARGRI